MKKTASSAPLDNRTDPCEHGGRPAWTVRRTPRGVVISLLPNCRPDRVIDGSYDKWEAKMRSEMTSEFGPMAFERQYGLNWTTPFGEPFYAEAASRLIERAPGEFEGWYVKPARRLLNAPILVGHDFGYKRAGLMLAQFDDPRRGGSGILWYMRELRVTELVCHEVCALGRYMTGRASLADLKREKRPDALAWIEAHDLKPWFAPELSRRLTWLDYGAKHEKEIRSGLASSREELSWGDQFRRQGVYVRGIPQNWTHAETVMRHLLREGRVRGLPRMLVDPSCVWWLRGLAGGLVVAPLGQRMGGYKRDEEFEDVADMAHYIAQAVYRRRDLSPLEEEDAIARGEKPKPRRSPYENARQPAGSEPARSWAIMETI